MQYSRGSSRMMTIDETITKHYSELQERAKKHNSNSKILEADEVLDNVLITAINKFRKTKATEEEMLQYIWRTMYMESKFLPKRELETFVPLDDLLEKEDSD